MSNWNYPRIHNSVRFIKKSGQEYYLHDQVTDRRFEVDEELFDFALYLDGYTDPASIEGVSESAALEALDKLEKCDLLGYPERSQQKGEMYRNGRCLHTRNGKQNFVRQFLLHPNMMTLMVIAIMVYSYFTRQTVFFLLAAALIAFRLIGLSVIEIRHKLETYADLDGSEDAF